MQSEKYTDATTNPDIDPKALKYVFKAVVSSLRQTGTIFGGDVVFCQYDQDGSWHRYRLRPSAGMVVAAIAATGIIPKFGGFRMGSWSPNKGPYWAGYDI